MYDVQCLLLDSKCCANSCSEAMGTLFPESEQNMRGRVCTTSTRLTKLMQTEQLTLHLCLLPALLFYHANNMSPCCRQVRTGVQCDKQH